jgi:hypothetical protein
VPLSQVASFDFVQFEVQRFDPGTVVVSQGLDGGEIVVTAGIQALYPGRKVRLLGSSS